MILTRHPYFDLADYPQHLHYVFTFTPKYVGFFQEGGSLKAKIPLPLWQDYLDQDWDPDERARVVAYLRAHPIIHDFRGTRMCCGTANPMCERNDGTYTWPGFFAHRVERHGVRPPEEFVQHTR